MQLAQNGREASDPHVVVLDDDPVVLRLVVHVLEHAGLRVGAYSSPLKFLAEAKLEPPCCLLLDVQMPELTGPEIHRKLLERELPPAIVFISGGADIPTSVRAMKAGAVDFLAKPFAVDELLAAVHEALARSAGQLTAHRERCTARELLDRLTPRERQVCERVVRGLSSKQIAAELGAAVKTINVHRSRIIAKLGVSCVAELVRLVVKADLPTAER